MSLLGGGDFMFSTCVYLYNIPPHYYMPPATKKAKKQQEKASHAQSIKLLHQSRLVSPAASAGPDPSSSAASTPPISSAGSDVEPADIGAGDQSDVDGRNSEASSPESRCYCHFRLILMMG
jgi:hypothetical protein